MQVHYISRAEMSSRSRRAKAFVVSGSRPTLKFLVQGEKIWLGAFASHVILYLCATIPLDETFEQVFRERTRFEALENLPRDRTILLEGAGECDVAGNVTGWQSQGFGVVTPRPLQPVVVTALQAWCTCAGRAAFAVDEIILG